MTSKMGRNKRPKKERKKSDVLATTSRAKEEHDLVYYSHDRVELMRQVFSLMKTKEIRAIAPESVKKLSIDEIKELCLEELLGISSKRLCAVLDGAPPPTDSESSDSEPPQPEIVETISLDSRSEDDSTKKKKPKKKKKSPETNPLLELLELQARARAIQTQLDRQASTAVTNAPSTAVKSETHTSTVIISDDDEKLSILPADSGSTQKIRKRKKTKSGKRSKKSTSTGQPEAVSKRSASDVAEIQVDHKRKTKDNSKDIKMNRGGVITVIPDDDNHSEHSSSRPNKFSTKSKTVSEYKKSKDSTITIPKSGTTSRKIRLNKDSVVISVANVSDKGNSCPANAVKLNSSVSKENKVEKGKKINSIVTTSKVNLKSGKRSQKTSEGKVKRKKRFDKREVGKEAVDYEAINIDLSDTEKADLLEDLHQRNLDNVTSSSVDSESSSSSGSCCSRSSSDSQTDFSHDKFTKDSCNVKGKQVNTNKGSSATSPVDINVESNVDSIIIKPKNAETQFYNDKKNEKDMSINNDKNKVISGDDIEPDLDLSNQKVTDPVTSDTAITNQFIREITQMQQLSKENIHTSSDKTIEVSCIENIPIIPDDSYKQNLVIETDKSFNTQIEEKKRNNDSNLNKDIENKIVNKSNDAELHNTKQCDNTICLNDNMLMTKDLSDTIAKNAEKPQINCNIEEKKNEKEHSEEGEITDKSSSDIEALEMKPDIVCISDEDTENIVEVKKSNKSKKIKKKKHKKKHQKDKGSSLEKDIQNKQTHETMNTTTSENRTASEIMTTMQHPTSSKLNSPQKIDSENIYEIMELSDDSSCCEVEGVSVLSKEPTCEEIKALSAKIDEIEREEVVTEEQIQEHKSREANKKSNADDLETIENISWKDRYLDSKKVKQVLSTANILNSLRKKNKELKKMMADSKCKEMNILNEVEDINLDTVSKISEEGSINQYNTLQSSTKYVDPLPEPKSPVEKTAENSKGNVTGEMKKDAKQLLKMYKRLLKYNDINKRKDPNRKKKSKKQNKNKDGDSVSVATSEVT